MTHTVWAVDTLTEIRGLVSYSERGPGTEAERQTAIHLSNRLRQLGRNAAIEPIKVRPNVGLAYAVHAVAAIIASVLSVSTPVVGLALAGFTAISLLSDLGASSISARLATVPRPSQNVVSREGLQKPGTLILVAHYDAGSSAAMFSPKARAILHRASQLVRHRLGGLQLFFWSIVGVTVCSGLRLLLGASVAVSLVQFVFTVLLIFCAVAAADYVLAPVSPGANDNASGVATALRLASRYAGSLSAFNLWVVFPGSEEGLVGGTKRFLKRHGDELNPERTLFVNIDAVGGGSPHYTASEGPLVALKYHPLLVELCASVTQPPARGLFNLHATSSAYTARIEGYAAVSIGCRDEQGAIPHSHRQTDTAEQLDPKALESSYQYLCQLIEQIDEQIGPTLQAPSTQSRRPSPA